MSDSLSPGQVLAGRFELRERLGVGRFATVWLAFDQANDLLVALKILTDSSHRAALKSEWQTLRSLNHAHIVRVFDFFDADHVFYSMYFLDGASLAEIDVRPQAELLKAAGLIADALAYLHARDVIHGDIAPANIVFDRGGAPYLIDFGSAWRGETPVSDSRGTPAYQRDGGISEKPAAADDLYSLGQVLRESSADLNETGLSLLQELQRNDSAALTAAGFVAALKIQGYSPARLPPAAIPAREFATVTAVQPESLARQTYSDSNRTAARNDVDEGGRSRWVWVALGLLLATGIYVVGFLEPPDGTAIERKTANIPALEDIEVEPDPMAEDEEVEFSEGQLDTSTRTQAVQDKMATDRVLGELLTKQEVLEKRGVELWAGTEYRQALTLYAAGDRYYLAKDYPQALQEYQRTVEVFDELIGRADQEFERTMQKAEAALSAADGVAARRLYELALKISPADAAAVAGLERATTLDDVLALLEAGDNAEAQFEYEAALLAFEKAAELDPAWPAASESLQRIRGKIRDRDFRALMSDGFFALDNGELGKAQTAFRAARKLKPSSSEPTDGLQQVDQTRRLGTINRALSSATKAEAAEDWQAAIESYEKMLSADSNLVQAREGLANARARLALDQQLQRYVANPDSLSDQKEIEAASALLLRLVKIRQPGDRLTAQKNELSRVLKRAAEPLPVQLRSDGQTDVAVYKVGKLGRFMQTELSLRPGVYTVVGSRPGYKDVRLSLRVAPEIDMQPLIVQCEEAI